MTAGPAPHTALLAALGPATWGRANRELLAKIVTELTFEDVLSPEPVAPRDDHDVPEGGETAFRLAVSADTALTYTARRRHLGHWRVDPDSLQWEVAGAPRPLPDVADVVAVALPALGVDAPTTAGVICELANTVLSDAWQLAKGRPSVELARLDPALVECEMRGHPWIAANKGRLGFDADEPSSRPRRPRPGSTPTPPPTCPSTRGSGASGSCRCTPPTWPGGRWRRWARCPTATCPSSRSARWPTSTTPSAAT